MQDAFANGTIKRNILSFLWGPATYMLRCINVPSSTHSTLCGYFFIILFYMSTIQSILTSQIYMCIHLSTVDSISYFISISILTDGLFPLSTDCSFWESQHNIIHKEYLEWNLKLHIGWMRVPYSKGKGRWNDKLGKNAEQKFIPDFLKSPNSLRSCQALHHFKEDPLIAYTWTCLSSRLMKETRFNHYYYQSERHFLTTGRIKIWSASIQNISNRNLQLQQLNKSSRLDEQ